MTSQYNKKNPKDCDVDFVVQNLKVKPNVSVNNCGSPKPQIPTKKEEYRLATSRIKMLT